MNKKIIILIVLTLSLLCSHSLSAQEKIIPPSEGKSVLYVFRTKNLGALMNFRFFEKGNYLGKFNGRNYIRIECEPGKSIFWVKAENVDFIETEFEANKVYFVEANAVMGGFSAGVKFKLVDFSDEKQMKRIHELLEDKEVKTFDKAELEKDRQDMPRTIQSGMRVVQKKRAKGKKIKHITPDMNYKI